MESVVPLGWGNQGCLHRRGTKWAIRRFHHTGFFGVFLLGEERGV